MIFTYQENINMKKGKPESNQNVSLSISQPPKHTTMSDFLESPPLTLHSYSFSGSRKR